MVKADSLKTDQIQIQCSDAIQIPDLKVDFQILNIWYYSLVWALRKGAQVRRIFYWHACQSRANYVPKIDLIYVVANSITLRSIQ